MKRIHLLMAFLCLIAITACDRNDDLATNSSDDFSVEISGVINNTTVSGTVIAEISAKSRPGIKKIDVFVNDSLYATVNTPTYKLAWNTYKVKDGIYSIKAVAYDQNGLTKELKTSVTVSNPLITIADLQPNSYNPTREIHFIVMDLSCSVLAKVKFTGQSEIKIYPKTPIDINTIHVFEVLKPHNGDGTVVTSYLGVKRGGTWDRYPEQPVFKPNTMKRVKVTNLPSFDALTLSGDRAGTTYTRFSDLKPVLEGRDYYLSTTGKMFFSYEKNNTSYYNFYDLPSSNEMVIDASQATKPSIKKTIHYPTAEGLSVTITGKPYKDLHNQYNLDAKYKQGQTLNYFVPQEPMDSYLSLATIHTNDWNFSIYEGGLITELKPLDAKAVVTSPSLSMFRAKFTGKFDFYEATFTNSKNIHIRILAISSLTDFAYPDMGTIAGLADFSITDFKMVEFHLNTEHEFKPDVLPWNPFQGFIQTGAPSKKNSMRIR